MHLKPKFEDIIASPHLEKKRKRFKYILNLLPKNFTNNLFLEFGVANGRTLNMIAEILPNNKIYGFDSFEGLPEFYLDHKNKILKQKEFKQTTFPKVNNNCTLIKGLFENTLPDFLYENSNKQIGFVHIDCDLYGPTLYILRQLNKFFTKGSILLFDEFFSYKNEKFFYLDEGYAFNRFLSYSSINYKIICRGQLQLCMQIL